MNRKQSQGFTLIEVMIAMLIGIIGIVVMMQTFAVSEGFKRTASSGTDSQINGSVALYMLEREIRLAGFGFNGLTPLGCASITVWNTQTSKSFNMRMVPFEINPVGIPAGDPNTDVLLITYGTADSFVSGVQADQPTNTSTEPFTLYSNREGFKNGDLVVSIQPGGGPGGTASCVLHEITATPGAAGNCGVASPTPTSIAHGVNQYRSAYNQCNLTNVRFNSAPPGIKDPSNNLVPPVRMSTGGQLFNLGSAPSMRVYAIRNGNLTFCDMIANDCTVLANYTVLVNDIVSMRAVYGKDFSTPPSSLPGNGNVTQWDRTALPDAFTASRVLAVMIEVTSRSQVKEKPTSGTACDATTNPNRTDKTSQDWMGNAWAGIDLSTTPGMPANDWKCYRYKLFQTRVPIRNMIWRP